MDPHVQEMLCPRFTDSVAPQAVEVTTKEKSLWNFA